SNWRYAINVEQIAELLYVAPDDVIGRDGKRSIEWRGERVPLVELRYLLGLGGARVFKQSDDTAPAFARTAGALVASRKASLSGSESNATSPVRNKVPVFVTIAGDRKTAVAVDQFYEQREIIVKSLGSLGSKIKGVVGAVDLEGDDVALVLDLPSLL